MTTEAEPSATCKKPVRVLCDNSLFRFMFSDDVLVRPQRVTLFGNETTIQLAEVVPRKPDERRSRSLETVCDFARKGVLTLCTSDELMYEHWNSSESIRTANTGTELLRGIELQWLPTPITRSRFMHGGERELEKAARLDFFRLLRSEGTRNPSRDWHSTLAGRVTSFEVESFKQLDRFAEICSGLGPKDGKIIDAFHLWTGERSGASYFLTYDMRFINYITRTSRLALRCIPLVPNELIARLAAEYRHDDANSKIG